MKRLLVVSLIIMAVIITLISVTTIFQNVVFSEVEFSQRFLDRFDMRILGNQTTMAQFLNGEIYPVEQATDLGGVCRTWNVELPQSDSLHARMLIFETPTDMGIQKTEYKILATRHLGRIGDPNVPADFLVEAKRARVYCMASIGSLYGIVTVSAYGDTVEECTENIEEFLMQTFCVALD